MPKKEELAVRRFLLVLLLFAVILSGCQAKKETPKPPVGAVFAAFHFCPVDECDNVEIGLTTEPLPYTDTSIYDRWCVEVQFTRNSKDQTAAVEVIQVDPKAPVGLGDWVASDPIFNSDCTIFD